MTEIILASNSPRRRELLNLVGINHKVITSNADEGVEEGMPAQQVVYELALRKAESVFNEILPKNNTIIIGADTVVSLNGDILGKPEDERDALKMLQALSGKMHVVHTGVSIFYYIDNALKIDTFVSSTEVYFKNLSQKLIENYISTKEPLDKAGAYGIQGRGAALVEKINGDFYTVVGLPIAKVYELLERYI